MLHDVDEWESKCVLDDFFVGDRLSIGKKKVVLAPQFFFGGEEFPVFVGGILVNFVLIKYAVALLLFDPFILWLESGCNEPQVVGVVLTVLRFGLVDSVVYFLQAEFKRSFVFYFQYFQFVCLLNRYVFIHAHQHQQLSVIFMLDELEFDMGFALKVAEVAFYLVFGRKIKHHNEVPVFNGFLSFLGEQLFRSRFQELKKGTWSHFVYTFIFLNLSNSLIIQSFNQL